MKRALAAGIILVAGSCGTAEAADGLIVVEARGVPFKPGQVIAADAPLTLAEGQVVTLIAANGNTLRLRGPYNKVPGAGEGAEVADLSVAFKALLTRKGAQTNDVYAVRAGGAVTLPEPWVVDVSRPARICVRENTPLVLWRPEASRDASLTISPYDHSWKARSTWQSGADRLTVPASVPLQDGATYTIGYGENQAALALRRVPAALPTDAARAAWLADVGCEAQAEALIRTLQ
jgi:hypothetical protein